MFAPGGVDVADRDHLRVGLVQEIVHQSPALRAGTDEAQSDTVIGSLLTRSGPGRGQQHRRSEGGERGCFEELAAIQLE